MKNILFLFVLVTSLLLNAQETDTEVFSAIKGTQSKSRMLNFNILSDKASIEVSGSGADFFVISSDKEKTQNIKLHFAPSNDFVGLAMATLNAKDEKGNILESIRLKGLSSRALEGKNEPSLQQVTEALGYDIDLGWTSLANHTLAELQGNELPTSLFNKASEKNVEMIPVARYSPPFRLPFGYYLELNGKPELHQLGVLASSEKHYEHQTLFPLIIEGSFSFDPKDASFGFYTTSPSHTAYSEDKWNEKLNPNQAAHAVRIYAVNDSEGKAVENTILICFEEAKNGDYQDYVFLVKNIVQKP